MRLRDGLDRKHFDILLNRYAGILCVIKQRCSIHWIFLTEYVSLTNLETTYVEIMCSHIVSVHKICHSGQPSILGLNLSSYYVRLVGDTTEISI